MSLTILVADDEPTVVRVLTRFLVRDGHVVRTASTALETLDLIEGEHFDVVLLDANMPGNGRTVIDALTAHPPYPGKIILMSGASFEELGSLPESVRHLPKPFTFESVRRVIGTGR